MHGQTLRVRVNACVKTACACYCVCNQCACVYLCVGHQFCMRMKPQRQNANRESLFHGLTCIFHACSLALHTRNTHVYRILHVCNIYYMRVHAQCDATHGIVLPLCMCHTCHACVMHVRSTRGPFKLWVICTIRTYYIMH